MPAAAWMRARKLLGLPRLLPRRSRSAQDVGRAHQGLIFFGFSSSSSSSLYSAGAGAAGEPSQKKKRSTARKVVTIGAISLAGGVALSAINDLAIFHGCTRCRKAIEKATENAEVVRAIGVPIARGPWYDASVVLGHRQRSVSCTFPVTGPRGSGVFQIEAIRNGEDGVLSFLRHHDWEILAMDARLELQAAAAAAEAEAASDDDAHHHQPLVMNLNLMSSTADDDGCKS